MTTMLMMMIITLMKTMMMAMTVMFLPHGATESLHPALSPLFADFPFISIDFNRAILTP